MPGNLELFLVDKGRPTALTNDPGLDYHAAPTPDGSGVVFTSERDGDPDLWWLDLATGETRVLLQTDVFEDAPAISANGRRIAFVSNRDGATGVYVAAFDASDLEATAAHLSDATLLTPEPGSDFRPAFSPDGRWIAYSSNADAPMGFGSNVWIVPSDPASETAPHQLTSLPDELPEGFPFTNIWNGSPAWSADGRSVVYQAMTWGGDPFFEVAASEVRQVDVETGEETTLSPEGVIAARPFRMADGRWGWSEYQSGEHPGMPGAWAVRTADGQIAKLAAPGSELFAAQPLPDGRLVAFGSGPTSGPRSQLFGRPLVADDQSHVRKAGDHFLQMMPIRGAFPVPSPDGRTWAHGHLNLEFYDPASKEQKVIMEPPGGPAHGMGMWGASWAPDGSWLVANHGMGFSPPDANIDIWRVNRDGSHPVNLTADSDANNAMPSVSPDGRSIVFRSGRDGDFDLYLMKPDGTDVRRLTDGEGTETMPSWAPDGRRIAFVWAKPGEHGPNHDVYMLDLDEQGDVVDGSLRRVTESPGFDTHPVFSPNGEWIVITTDRYGWNDERTFVFHPQPYGELLAIHLGDGTKVRLTHNKWEDGLARWLPMPLDELTHPERTEHPAPDQQIAQGTE